MIPIAIDAGQVENETNLSRNSIEIRETEIRK